MTLQQRTVNTPKNVSSNEASRVAKLNSTYIGFVKDNVDALKMNRIKVWIPELSSDIYKGYYTINYCSPFAGASGLDSVSNNNQSQTSHGFWAPTPALENEVVVMFVNGDPNRGIYIGCMYQQYMNNMVPGIPKGDSTSTAANGDSAAPVQEYNKKNNSEAAKDSPARPPYTKLSDALTNQGTAYDDIRGNTTSSARRESPSQVMGILSPGGSQFVVDDHADNQFIRFRTANGAQILINDTVGCIYMITRSGNSWIEISDDAIDVYSAKSVNIRAQQDLNFHSDKNVNIYGTMGINLVTPNSINMSAVTGINLKTDQSINGAAGNMINLVSTSDTNISSYAKYNVFSTSDIAINTSGNMGITVANDLNIMCAQVNMNSGQGPQATQAAKEIQIEIKTMSDRSLDGNGAELMTKTICSRLPTHEPFIGHPGQSSGPARASVDLNYSNRTNADGPSTTSNTGGGGGSAPADIQPGQTSSDSTLPTQTGGDVTVPPGDDSGWFMPVSGAVNSPYGNRSGGFHPGVDIHGNSGKTIVATKSGKVVFAQMGFSGSGYGGYGNCVCIDHGGGVTSIYGHMASISVNKGATVTQGQALGTVGSTGMSTGPHLHFELRTNGSHFDPGKVLSALGKNGSSVTAGGTGAPATTMLASNAPKVTTSPTGGSNV